VVLSSAAQTSQGILSGVARDSTGAVVPNATVTVTNEQTGEKRTVKTGGDGGYRIEALTPGKYDLVAVSAGFNTTNIKDVPVAASQVSSYDIKLAVGATSTEVEVEAIQATVDTDNGVLSGTVSSRELDKLPIFSLNPVELATTVPGVQPVSTPGGQFSNGIDIQVNGARPRANNFLMDGQEINDVGIAGQAFQPQIPDIFDAVTVFTNSASAEYGRGGGGIINMVTKSGTNQYHGELYERYTGSGLNSIPGEYRGSQFIKTRYDQHTFGFTAGGRILRDKLFAFGAGEWARYYGQETPGVNLLPDAAGYATLQTITGPAAAQVQLLDSYLSNGAYLNTDLQYGSASGAPISYNVGVLPGCPSTGCVVTFAGFQRPNAPELNPDTQWMYRIDYTPWEKDHVAFRYLHDRTSLSPDFFNNPNALAGFDTLQGGPTELGEGFWTHIFGPHLLNEFRVSEARLAFTFAPTPQTLANPLNSQYSITFAKLTGTTTAGSLGFPELGPNQNFPQGRKEDLYQFQDTVRYTLGRQSISVGADIGRLIEIDLVSQNALGTLGFVSGGDLPGDPNSTNCPTYPNCVAGNSLGNFLQNQLGPSGTATKTFGKTRVDSHGYRSAVFVEDDIKVSADLSLNLGLRYDYLTNPENSLPYPGVDPNNLSAPINAVVPIQNDTNNLGPRFGFAYSPHNGLGFLGDGKTSLRGGFGVFYDSTFSNILVNSTQSSPNAVAGTLIQTTGNGLSNATGLIPTISPTLSPLSSVESENSHLVNPITYEYNLGVERQLPGDIIFGVRYVGSRGEKLFANQQYNYFNGLTGQRLNPARGAIVLRGNYADSDYNGLEVSGTYNLKHGLSVRTNYVYSKDLDDGSEIFTVGSDSTSYSANLAPGGRGQDWGPSAYDHRHFFSVAYLYTVPGLHSSNRVTDLAENILTRNWTVSGVTQLQSGAYATFSTNGIDLNGDGSTSNDRPIVENKSASLQSVGIDGYFVGGTPGVYYDLAANNATNALNPVSVSSVHFLVPYFPNNSYLHQEIGRNSYELPGTTQWNMALEKGFAVKERARFILRAEAQNLFNHNDLAVGDTDVLDAGAGFLTPSRTASPAIGANQRTLVLWGKFEF
jgi:outer membrane receptor protein involved in Fe transport